MIEVGRSVFELEEMASQIQDNFVDGLGFSMLEEKRLNCVQMAKLDSDVASFNNVVMLKQ